jgi:hypothetical protein
MEKEPILVNTSVKYMIAYNAETLQQGIVVYNRRQAKELREKGFDTIVGDALFLCALSDHLLKLIPKLVVTPNQLIHQN